MATYELKHTGGDIWSWNLAPAWLNATSGRLYFHELLDNSPRISKDDWSGGKITREVRLPVEDSGTILATPYVGYQPPYPLWGVQVDKK